MPIPTIQAYRVQEWLDQGGDEVFRSNYQLSENATVFDVGGYRGDFAAEIVEKYGCLVFVFEPISGFSENIRQRFAGNPRVKVFDYGLGDADGQLTFDLDQDATSVATANSSKANSVIGDVRRFSAVVDELGVGEIDLVKLNIEGGEYAVINDINKAKFADKIKLLDVQFHDFVDSAMEKMTDSRNILLKSHTPAFAFDFVWERWIRNDLATEIDRKRQVLDIARLRESFVGVSRIVDTLKEAESDIRSDQTAGINAIYTKLDADKKAIEARLNWLAAQNEALKFELDNARARQDSFLETRIRRFAAGVLKRFIS